MISARDLAARLSDLLRRERGAMADFLVALADFDRRRLWLDLGHASLFSFLHQEFGLSKGAAHYRKVAAEMVQRFPQVVEPLRDGRLCFTSILELAKVITPESAGEVLPRFFHVSKREAMAVSAAIRPEAAPPQRAVVTALRERPVAPAALAPATSAPEAEPAPRVQPVELVHANAASTVRTAPSPRERDVAQPLTADLRRLHVTVSQRLLDKLEAARAALSHARPGATIEDVLEVGLDLVIERHAKRRGLVERPRRERRPSRPDHVPAEVKRAVWKRDGGRCQWPLEAGGICGSTLRVELDHVLAKARGGPPTIDNLRCVCRVHNQLAARQAFGDAWMDRFTRPLPDRVREGAAAAAVT